MRATLAALATAGLLAATACAPGADPATQESQPEDQSNQSTQSAQNDYNQEPLQDVAEYAKMVDPAWTVDAKVAGEPAVVGDTVLAYQTGASQNLTLVAYAAGDGQKKWESEVSIGVDPEVSTLAPLIIDVDGAAAVAFLKPLEEAKGVWVDLTVVDANTGKAVGAPGPHLVNGSPLSACSDGKPVCGQGFVKALEGADGAQGAGSDQHKSAMRYAFDPATGDFQQRDESDLPKVLFDQTLQHGIDLLNVGDGKEGLIVRRNADGTTMWQASAAALFGPETRAGSVGKEWLAAADGTLLIGDAIGVNKEADKFIGDISGNVTGMSFDAANAKLIAVDAATGKLVWERPGVRMCEGLKVPGGVVGDTAAFCEWTGGTYTLAEDGYSADATGQVIGIDTATGESIWKVEVGRLGVTMLDSSLPPNLVGTRTGLPITSADGSAVLVDSTTGDVQRFPAGSVFACAQSMGKQEVFSFVGAKRSVSKILGPQAVGACDDAKSFQDGLTMSVGGVRDAGIEASGGTFVIATEGGLAGYAVGE